MDRDVPTAERRSRPTGRRVPSKLICLPPLHVEPDFFTTRIGAEYSVNRSRAMVMALEQCGLLKDGFITENPLTYDWRPHLAPLALEDDSLVKDKSAISSCLNVVSMSSQCRLGVARIIARRRARGFDVIARRDNDRAPVSIYNQR